MPRACRRPGRGALDGLPAAGAPVAEARAAIARALVAAAPAAGAAEPAPAQETWEWPIAWPAANAMAA
ncbi:hypothetical protein CJO79_20200 (plasmid) [Ralstonia solanacearum]|nr:hypothetical protein CJO76_20220 [Ralstonia solanacearum]AXV93303.1 hypothetical protein CJO79_20200 [Ralstonia solanacearum]AXW21341.1 hypothetical protein CJO85_20280 [Ralstonia solanacearum]AXW78200.1 hypothetical protein CJO97_20200 [Ralstonia solanacearum]